MSGSPGTRGAVPELRIQRSNAAPSRRERELVVYWMIATRRPAWNYALDRAIELAVELEKPLVVLEALRVEYPYASDRLHRFVLDGMRDNARSFAGSGALYHPYVEPRAGAGRGLLGALAKRAAAVVTDDWPCSFVPRMVAAAAKKLDVRLEAIDSNGLLPMRAADRVHSTARGFRSFLQRELPRFLGELPRARPFEKRALVPLRALPDDVLRKWPAASKELLEGKGAALASLPIDHEVAPVESTPGGTKAGRARLQRFAGELLDRYAQERNEPDAEVTSGLSPYLHFGHVSAHEILAALGTREGWSPNEVGGPMGGAREGWWGMGPAAEAFLDQLVTWRELGFNACALRGDVTSYESLPDWARATLDEHASDPRPHTYSQDELERAETADELWNAAQRELRAEGRIHNYLRMLWGKKILEWSPSPRAALERMLRLNDRWALDGRDPNSYSGIGWVLGRYDRPWGPERPIFGTIRYMTSASARRKLELARYLERYRADGGGAGTLFD